MGYYNTTDEYKRCYYINNSSIALEMFKNLNKWEFISCYRGPQQQSLEFIIPITVINVIIFVTGFFGNLAVCIVIIKHPSLHTATNYYLFNLAISDLTLLVFGLPNDVAMYWHVYPWTLGEFFCKFRALLSEMASYVSVLTIVAFSTERYFAICYPLYVHKMSGLQRPIKIIAGLWISGFISAFPFSVYTEVHYINIPNSTTQIEESAFCGMITLPEAFPICELSTIIFFVIPLLIISVQYIRMGVKISRTARKKLSKQLKGSVHRTNRKLQTNKNVIRMLSYVVIGFFVCWAPFHAQRLVYIYLKENDHFEEINNWMFVITGIFYYFSSTLNPILYNIMSDKMRSAFKEVIFGMQPINRPNSTSGFVREHKFDPNDVAHYNDTGSFVHKKVIVGMPQTKNKIIYEVASNNDDNQIHVAESVI